MNACFALNPQYDNKDTENNEFSHQIWYFYDGVDTIQVWVNFYDSVRGLVNIRNTKTLHDTTSIGFIKPEQLIHPNKLR